MDLRKASCDPWVWGQTILIAAVVVLAPALSRRLEGGRVGPALHWAGIALLAFGMGIAIKALADLGRNLTPGVEPLPEGTLTTTGIYRHIRHPFYTGAILILTGYASLWQNWIVALASLLLSATYLSAKARAEEAWLLRRFPTYERYRRETGKLTPRRRQPRWR